MSISCITDTFNNKFIDFTFPYTGKLFDGYWRSAVIKEMWKYNNNNVDINNGLHVSHYRIIQYHGNILLIFSYYN